MITGRSYLAVLLSGFLLMLLLAVAAVAKGSTPLPLSSIVSALAGPWAQQLGLPEVATTLQRIVVDLRLPRAVLAMVVGAGLALVGVMLQTVTRNDLADPFLFGLSSGASAGAVAVITTTGELLGVWTLPMAALAGGLLSAVTVLAIIRRSDTAGSSQLILAGLATSFLFGAVTHFLVFAGDQRAAHSVLFWTLGGLGLARWDNLPLGLLGLGMLMALALTRRHALDAMLAGEETAGTLGVDTARLRTEVFTIAAVATACFVALTGVIGFVGLMVPHLARGLVGALHGRLLALAAVGGAILLLASDLFCRTVLPPQELPVGIVTAAFGGLFVVVLVLRRPAHDRLP